MDKNKTHYELSTRTPFQYKDSERVAVKGTERLRMLIHQREAKGAALISDKADFRAREINDQKFLKGR